MPKTRSSSDEFWTSTTSFRSTVNRSSIEKRFEQVKTVHEIAPVFLENEAVQVFDVEFTDLQRQILRLLGVSETVYRARV